MNLSTFSICISVAVCFAFGLDADYLIVHPRILHNVNREKRGTSGESFPHEDSLVIDLLGSEMILELEVNREVTAPNLKTTYQSNGTWLDLQIAQSGCHFNGNIRNVTDSWVAVTVCAGLTGAIFDGETLRHIEPLTENASFHVQHIVKNANQLGNNFTCGLQGQIQSEKEPTSKIKRQSTWNREKPDPLYVELFLVIDYALYSRFKTIEKTVSHAVDVVNIVNSFYRPLSISVTLSSLEIWSERDVIHATADLEKLIKRFDQSHCARFRDEKHDAVHLLTGVKRDGTIGNAIGRATVGSMCWKFRSNACGVTMDLLGETDAFTASVLAHELGHNFGMQHDQKSCVCSEKSCIMAAEAEDIAAHKWSSCSKELIQERHHSFHCLKNKPNKCGNMVIDEGEDCDCGLIENCRNPCCDPATCKFVEDAQCAAGGCCNLRTCQFESSGKECRERKDECDLPEICSGSASECPADLHIHDGTFCGAEKENKRINVSTGWLTERRQPQACLSGTCSTQFMRKLPVCRVNCTENGVCNNLGKCHCFSGVPPFCHQQVATSEDPKRNALLWLLLLLLLLPIGKLIHVWQKRRRRNIDEWRKKRKSNLTLSIRPAPSVTTLLSSGSTPSSARTPLSAATTTTPATPERGVTNPALELDEAPSGQRLAVPRVRFCVPSRPAPPPPIKLNQPQNSAGHTPETRVLGAMGHALHQSNPLLPVWKKPSQQQQENPAPPPPHAFMKSKF